MPVVVADGQVIQQVRPDHVIVVQPVVFRQAVRGEAGSRKTLELVDAQRGRAAEMAVEITDAVL